VLQQTPRAVTAAPPSEVIVPPQVATVLFIPVILEVVRTGVAEDSCVVVSDDFLQPAINIEQSTIPNEIRMSR